MPTSRTAALYSPELLALAIELADFPFDPQAPVTGEARSRSCGSTIALSSARPDRIERLGLRIRPGQHFDLTNPQEDARFRDYWPDYLGLLERRGVSREDAQTVVRTRNTVIAACYRRGWDIPQNLG